MAKQILIKNVANRNDGNAAGQVIAIRKSSIGYIWINGQRYGYNIDKLATNRIDFDQISARTEPRRTIFVRRK